MDDRVWLCYSVSMDTVLAGTWTTDRFLAWEDKQEGKHEFDGRHVIPMTGGSLGHQRIVFNLMVALSSLVDGRKHHAANEMRLCIGWKVRYPDACVFQNGFDQTARTLTDAVVIFEVLQASATTDRVERLLDYGAWIASAHTGGAISLLRGPYIKQVQSGR